MADAKRRGARRIGTRGLAAVAVAAALLVASSAQPNAAQADTAQTGASPEALLEAWLDALARGDYAAYVECLHTLTRQVPEYGSEEAMAFWSGEMDELRRLGFKGQFAFEAVTEDGARIPAGSVRALPIVDGEPMREAIILIQEAGHWKILRLFS